MADRLNVITLSGSLRQGSYNTALSHQLPKWAPEGMSITAAPAWADLPTYNADDQGASGFPATATKLSDAIRAAAGVFIVSPEYNYGRARRLKNAVRLGVANERPAVQGQARGACSRSPAAHSAAAACSISGARSWCSSRR